MTVGCLYEALLFFTLYFIIWTLYHINEDHTDIQESTADGDTLYPQMSSW